MGKYVPLTDYSGESSYRFFSKGSILSDIKPFQAEKGKG